MKAYQKPQVTKVALKPEEAVLSGCKTAAGGALRGGQCLVPACAAVNGS